MRTPPVYLKLLLILSLVLGTALTAYAAGAYKWIDKDGEIHYTQLPPPDGQAERILSKPSGAGADSAQAAIDDLKARLDETQRQRKEEAAKQAAVKAEAETKAANCAKVRAQLTDLLTHSRVKMIAEDGTATRLTEEERQAKMAEQQTYLEDNCQGI
jgi:hypothetical protein